MEKGTTALLIGLFILFGLAYSPLKEMARKNQSADNRRTSSIGNKEDINTNNNNYSSTDASKDIADAEKRIQKLEKELDKKIEESKRSPYYGKISTSRIYGLGNKEPGNEYLIISNSLKNGEEVDITGWYLKSEVTGYYAIIGKASLLPFPFTKTESDVVIKRGDKVYITKGFSPIGISFRTNICTGYFEENTDFVPNLQKSCPKVSSEELPTFSSVYDRNDECINLIERIPRCRTRNSEYLRDLPDTVTSSCKAYIETNVNYNACVAKHFSDTDFPGNEYRLYLNKFGPLWRTEREKINLHDSNGLVVDTITIN